MNTTPSPIPESQYSFTGNINDINHFTRQQLEDRDAQWMERITALEADRKMLRDALTVAVTQNEHDMLMTGDELRAARNVLENTHD